MNPTYSEYGAMTPEMWEIQSPLTFTPFVEREDAFGNVKRIFLQRRVFDLDNAKQWRDKMTEHAGLPVAGYTPQSDDKKQIVNRTKELEERVLRHLDSLKDNAAVDQRMIAIARTGIQEAFMWANRAVFQPSRVKLPEDDA